MSASKGQVLWLTGMPGAGKTTLATLLIGALHERSVATLWLDSDALRKVLTPEASYSNADRDHFYAVVGHLAMLGAQGGVCVVVSAVATKQRYRDTVRAAVDTFVEIYLHCDTATLRQRDIKGLYAQSDAGTIRNLPGQGAPFEAPSDAELVLDSTHTPPAALLTQVLDYLARVT